MKIGQIAATATAATCAAILTASVAIADDTVPAPGRGAAPEISVQSVASKCKGAAPKTVAVTYYRGPSKVYLRCGTKSYGYKHLVARKRWSTNFSNKIKKTIWSGTIVTNTPGERTYERIVVQCPPSIQFRVVTNPGPYGKDPRINPQGIITAYKPAAIKAKAC
ncbi:hypothetical protein [Streptomyces sp. NPDC001054]